MGGMTTPEVLDCHGLTVSGFFCRISQTLNPLQDKGLRLRLKKIHLMRYFSLDLDTAGCVYFQKREAKRHDQKKPLPSLW